MAYSITTTIPNATDVYVPSFDQSARVIVDFARNPKDFIVNQLTKIVTAKQPTGFFRVWDPEENFRIASDLAYTMWFPGQPMPEGPQEKPGGAYKPFICERRALQIPMAYEEKENAPFDLQSKYFNTLAQKMMTVRTKVFYDVLFDTNNHLSDHVGTATALGGGLWSAATTSNNYIRKTFTEVGNTILKDTGGVVEYTQLTCVMSPATAQKLGQTPEVLDFIAQQPGAMDWQKGKNLSYNLPDTLYGVKIIVDKTVQNLGKRQGAASNSFAADTSNFTVAFLTRQGEMEGNVSENDFSSMTTFVWQGNEMKTETFDEYWNKRYRLSVTDYFGTYLVSPWSAYLVTNCFS